MSGSNLNRALEELAAKRNIDKLYIIERLEASLAKSYKKTLVSDWDVKVTIDSESGEIFVFELVPVGTPDPDTGEYSKFEERDVTPENISRTAALNAKGVIDAIVKDAAKMRIYEDYSGRVGELISGNVLQCMKDYTIIKISEGVEAELPHYETKRFEGERNERPDNETYYHNKRIEALIIDVKDPTVVTESNKPKSDQSKCSIVVSRTHPDFVKKLIEREVPEIYDGIVEIKSIAREPGARSKVAVFSNDPNLDPVGACVGLKGERIRGVVSELNSERVDIIAWSDDPGTYIANALSPAKVKSVIVDSDKNYVTVIVDEEQLSLAIGKVGQNARLAARLTGWHIDIKSASFAGASVSDDTNILIGDEANYTEGGFCAYVSESGSHCRNHARPGSDYCGVHSDNA